MIKVNLIKDHTVIPIAKGMSTIESIVYHAVLVLMLIGPFALGMYTMHLINTTSFRSIIGL